MRTTFCLNFYARNSKMNKAGEAPIECSIIINGERVMFNLPMKVKPSDFQKKRKPKEIQDYLTLQDTKIKEIVNQLIDNSIPVTADNLRKYIRTGGVQAYRIRDLFNDYLSILSKRVDVDLTMAVYRKYQLVRDLFFKYVNPDDDCTTITNAVVKKYQVDIYAKYDASTAAGYLTRLKTYIRFGMDNNHIKINPLQGIKVNKGKKPIVYLTEAELNKIITCDIENQSLSNVRDMFVLQASTGLSYIDMYNLRPEDIHITEDGTHYINKCRHKTSVQYTSVILPAGVDVLKKHNYQMRIISNQKLNVMLKVIQTITGISTTLTTHVARRTYATTLVNRGCPILSVSKALGHSSVKITQSAYAEVLNKTIIDDIKKIL